MCGDFIVASQEVDGVTRCQVRLSHSAAFKDTLHAYVRSYNKEHGTKITVGFPKPFEFRLREQRKKTR